MKRIITNLKKNWIQYGFETIVVTIGVIGAFSLESWHEKSRMKGIEIKLLNEMITGLENDLQILDYNIALHESGAKACKIILESIAQDNPYNDSLSLYFAMVNNYTVFAPQEGAYESIKSLGIELIQNDEIRLKTIKLHEQEYLTFQQNDKNFMSQVLDLKMNLYPALFEEWNLFDFEKINLSGGHYGGHMVPINFEALKTDRVYQYHLKSLKRAHYFLIYYNNYIKLEIKSLIELITQELDSIKN